MRTKTLELVQAIRSKYVGTADEHELLRQLEIAYLDGIVRNDIKQLEDQLRAQIERATEDNKFASLICSLCPLESYFRDWKLAQGSSYDMAWRKQKMREVLDTHGMTLEDFQEIFK